MRGSDFPENRAVEMCIRDRETIDLIEGCDAGIHAGDVDTPDIYEKLKGQKPLYLVRGNNDGGWAGQLPESLRFELEGVPIFLIHNRKDIRETGENVKPVSYTHLRSSAYLKGAGRIKKNILPAPFMYLWTRMIFV